MAKYQTDYLLNTSHQSFIRVGLNKALKIVQTPSEFRWLNRELYLFFLAILAGLLGSGMAVIFRKSVSVFQLLVYGQSEDLSLIFAGETLIASWRLWAIPLLCSALIAPLVWKWVPESRGEGVPDILEAVRLRNGKIKWQVIPAKLFASVVSLSTIASVGREGPIIASAAALASGVCQWLKIPKTYWNVMIACAGAAGIAATFNTPIAGAFFMAEVIMGSFSMEHFPSIILASILGTVVGHHFFGIRPAFNLPQHFALHHPAELLGFIALGVLAGITSVFFIQGIGWIRKLWDNAPIPNLIKPPLGALMLILTGIYLCPNIIGNGYPTIEHLIGSHPASAHLMRPEVWFLIFLIVAKIIAVGISLGAGFSGGVFAPSLFVGAPLGYLVGLLALRVSDTLNVSVSPETYAVIGMAAVFTGVSKAPITAIIMIFEMTQDYQLTLPLMAACVISYVVSKSIHKESIYTEKLIKKGISLSDLNHEQLLMHHYTVEDLMKKDEEPVVYPNTTIQEATRIMLKYQRHYLFLLSQGGILEGILTLAHLKSYLLAEDARIYDPIDKIIDPRPVFVYPAMPLTDAMQVFWHTHLEELPVIDQETQILLGVLWERDIIGLYNSEILKQHDTLGVFAVHDGDQHNYEHLELPEGYILKKMPVLEQWENKRIMDLGLREDWGINILTVERMTSNGSMVSLPPTGAEVLNSEDHLVLMGPVAQVNKLLHELKLDLA